MQSKLLNILACPKCHSLLDINEKEQTLRCQHDHLVYTIMDGIPVLLEEEAHTFSESFTDQNSEEIR